MVIGTATLGGSGGGGGGSGSGVGVGVGWEWEGGWRDGQGDVPGLGHSTSYFRVFSVNNVASKLSGNRVYDSRHFIVHFLERLHGMLPGTNS